MKCLKSCLVLAVAFAAATLAAKETHAGVILATGTGYNVSVNLNLKLASTLDVNASVGPTSYSSVTAPPSFTASDSLASLSVTAGSIPLGTLLDLSSGLLTSSATSDVDGLGLIGTTSAQASVAGLSLDVLDFLLAPTVLSIGAEAITSTASVTGGYGSLTGVGSTVFADLSISLLGTNVATINGSVAANTGIDVSSILGGVSIFLNEQVATGDGISSLGFTTNAIRIAFSNVGITGVGVLNGDLIISHAEAQQFATPTAAVPEPSSLAMCGTAGLLGLAGWHRRRRRAA